MGGLQAGRGTALMGREFSGTMGVLLGLVVSTPSVFGASPERGESLYLNHCLSCHESTAHIRENRRAKTLAEVRRWVARWSAQLELGWGLNEVDDVTAYLNRTYYRLGDVSGAPCGPRVVKCDILRIIPRTPTSRGLWP